MTNEKAVEAMKQTKAWVEAVEALAQEEWPRFSWIPWSDASERARDDIRALAAEKLAVALPHLRPIIEREAFKEAAKVAEACDEDGVQFYADGHDIAADLRALATLPEPPADKDRGDV